MVPAIFMQSEHPAWESCRVIRPPLVQAYRDLWGEDGFQTFFYSEELCNEALTLAGAGLLAFARKVHEAKPSRLVFLDHAPSPAPLLLALAEVYGTDPLPPVFIHVYGDFTLWAPWWKQCESVLCKTSVTLICASARQANLISRVLNEPAHSVDISPFPVDTLQYRFDAELRKRMRAQLNLREDEFVLLYSGRISLQKNVDLLMRRVEAFANQTGLPIRLLICGKFDDLGSPLFGVREAMGSVFTRFQSSLTDRMTYLGHLQAQELLGVYNAADCYVSMSLHHDEDFGMAPAEALCCGTPVILSSWGGYGGFVSENEKDCRLLPVRKFDVCEGTFFRSLLAQALNPENDSTRADRARRYHGRLSIRAATISLQAIHRRPLVGFRGFAPQFDHLVNRMQAKVAYPDASIEGSFYPFLYDAYRGF